MGMDAQAAGPLAAAAQQYQGQQGGGGQGIATLPPGQGGAGGNDMLSRLKPLLQQRMAQMQQAGGAQPPQQDMAGGSPQMPSLGGPPSGPIQMPQGAQPMPGGVEMSTPKPAWQQLQEQGIAGQGSAAANQAKLRELNGGAGAGGSMPFGGGDPMQAIRQKILDAAGAGAVRRDAKPGQGGVANSGGMPRGVRAGIPSPGSALPTQVADGAEGGMTQTANPPGGGAGGNARPRNGVRRGARVNY